MPVPLADRLRRLLPQGDATSRSARVRRAALRGLYRGGIPRGVSRFRPVDNPALEFLAVDSQVLEQLIQNEGLRVVGAEYSLETGRVEFL